MNLLLLAGNLLLFLHILYTHPATEQGCRNCGKGNVAAKRIKFINKSTFTRIAGVELDNIFQITPEKNMTVCAQRCDANLTCTVFEFNKPYKLCLLSTSYAVIDQDLVSNAFATAIFVKIVGKFEKKLPKGPESCLSRDEYSEYLITNVTQFLKNGTETRNDTTSTSTGATSNLPSTPPSESTSSASADPTPGAEINYGTSGGTTTSDMETTSTPTDSADSATPSDAVTVEEEKATTAAGLSPTASKLPFDPVTETPSTTIRDTTQSSISSTTQKPSTVSSSSTSVTETTSTTTSTSMSTGTTTTSQPLKPSSSTVSSTTTVSSTPTSSSKSSSTSADSTTTEAQQESAELLKSEAQITTESTAWAESIEVSPTTSTAGQTFKQQPTTTTGSRVIAGKILLGEREYLVAVNGDFAKEYAVDFKAIKKGVVLGTAIHVNPLCKLEFEMVDRQSVIHTIKLDNWKGRVLMTTTFTQNGLLLINAEGMCNTA